MEVTKNDLQLVMLTMETIGLYHRTDAKKMAKVCCDVLGSRYIAEYFGVDHSDSLPRLEKYIYNREF